MKWITVWILMRASCGKQHREACSGCYRRWPFLVGGMAERLIPASRLHLTDRIVTEPMRPDTEGCQAYFFGMDRSKSPLLQHILSEIHHSRLMAARLRGCAS